MVNLEKQRYRRSKLGLVSVILGAQTHSSKLRGHPKPEYTLAELRKWCLSSAVFNTLYAEWVDSDYNMLLTPSLDRKDDYKHYYFDNLKVTTWELNRARVWEDKRDGINTKQARAIIRIDAKGVEREFYSIRQAEREVGTIHNNISYACKNGSFADGFKWRYKDTPLVSKIYGKVCQEVLQYDLNGTLIGRYKTAREAASITGVSRYGIMNNMEVDTPMKKYDFNFKKGKYEFRESK